MAAIRKKRFRIATAFSRRQRHFRGQPTEVARTKGTFSRDCCRWRTARRWWRTMSARHASCAPWKSIWISRAAKAASFSAAMSATNITIPGTRDEDDARRPTEVIQSGDEIYSFRPGRVAGGRPSVSRPIQSRDRKSGAAVSDRAVAMNRLWRFLDDSGSGLLTRRENPTEPPNYFIRTGASSKPLTHFADPMPQACRNQEAIGYLQARGRRAAFFHALPARRLQAGHEAAHGGLGISI